MKAVFVNSSNFVTGVVHVAPNMGAIPSGGPSSLIYEVGDAVAVMPGYLCTVQNGTPMFAPAYTPNIVSIGVFLSSIQSLEMNALEASTDPLVQAFVKLCNDPRVLAIDLNEPRVQFDVQYAAGIVAAPTGAANAGQMIATPCIGGATRATAILGGNLLAATS